MSEQLELHVNGPLKTLTTHVEGIDKRTEGSEAGTSDMLKAVERLQESIIGHRKQGFISHEEHMAEVFDIEERNRCKVFQTDFLTAQSQSENGRLSSTIQKLSDKIQTLEGMLFVAEDLSETNQQAAEVARDKVREQAAELKAVNDAAGIVLVDLKSRTDELASMTNAHTRQTSKVTLLESELEAAKTEGRKLVEENSKYTEEVTGLKRQTNGIKALNKKIAELESSLIDKNDLVAQHEKSMGKFENHLKMAAEHNESLVEQNEESTRQIAEYAQQEHVLTGLSKENQTLTSLLQKTETSLKGAREETVRLSGAFQKAENNLTTLRNEHEKGMYELEASKNPCRNVASRVKSASRMS